MNIDFLDRKSNVSLNLEDLYSRFGYWKYTMNRFESYAFYMENENFLNDNRVITLQGSSGKLLALKPDVTMSIVKNYKMLGKSKIYYNEPVFKVPQGESEFKEIHQAGIEYIGNVDVYQTAEVLNLAIKSLQTIGEDYRLCISHVGIVNEVLESLKFSVSEKYQVITYLQQKNSHDLTKYLMELGRVEDIKIFEILSKVDGDLNEGINFLIEQNMFKGLEFLREVATILSEITDCSKISLDFSHLSTTEYYNDLVFTGYVKGLANSVLSGGRYDNLLSKMGVRDKSALGFAVNLSEVSKLPAKKVSKRKIVRYNDTKKPLDMLKEANIWFEEGESFCILQGGSQ
ncbi:MAG: hypothetical protein ATN33_03010 [Epulopiscium sp. Nele67-Bin001]|nr:MAG: hypothetical protein ATN33_03010 [Epulopiscium sp. Nele67-Bin001]